MYISYYKKDKRRTDVFLRLIFQGDDVMKISNIGIKSVKKTQYKVEK